MIDNLEEFENIDIDSLFSVETESPKETSKPKKKEDPIEKDKGVIAQITEEEEEEEVLEEEQPKEAPKVLYDILKDLGHVEESVEFDGTVEKLEEVIQQIPITTFNKFIQKMDPDLRGLFSYALKNPNVEMKDLSDYFDSYLRPRILSHDINTEEGAEQFLRSYLPQTEQFVDEEAIGDYIDVIKDKGQLQKQAGLFYKKINDAYKNKELESQQLEEQKREEAKKMQQKTFEVIDKKSWDGERKSEVKKFMNTPGAASKVLKSIVSSPEFSAEFFNLLSYFEEQKGFEKLYTILENRKDSTEVKKKESIIGSHIQKMSKAPKSVDKKVTDFTTMVDEEVLRELFNEE